MRASHGVTTARSAGRVPRARAPIQRSINGARRARRASAYRSQAIFADLSFVSVLSNGDIDFWNVTPTGDHTANCETGDRYAEQLLAWLTHYPDTGEKYDVLKEIAFAMPKRDRHKGIEVGFWTQLSLRLMDLCGAPAPALRHTVWV